MRRLPRTSAGDAESSTDAVSAEVGRLSAWLKNDVWPLWLEHGVDWKRRAFLEHLQPDSLLCTADFLRLRVVTRQVFTFSHAARLNVDRAADAARMGVSFLRSARRRDGGLAWRFDLGNQPIDLTLDLYDHAFVLLAFAAASAVLDTDIMRREARLTIDFIDVSLRHDRIGFLERLPPHAPRRQNPHMHLLEACLAAFEAFGDEVYKDTADELVGLLLSSFFQRQKGALAEIFDDTLALDRTKDSFSVEPGHHYEWVWLISRFLSLFPESRHRVAAEAVAGALRDFADAFGTSGANGLIVDELDSEGRVATGSFRLWPQAERIKCEVRRPDHESRRAASGVKSIWHMIDGAPVGLWHERLDAKGDPVASPVPATSLYHLTCAILDATNVLSLRQTSGSTPMERERAGPGYLCVDSH